MNQALKVAEKLRGVIAEFRFAWENKSFAVGASIGVAPIDRESQGGPALLAAADAACYAAKGKGRNRVQAWAPDDAELAARRGEMQWVSRLTRALEEDRFRLYAQKIVPVLPEASEPAHYELLVRMEDESGRLVAPMAFIPAAERYNLMPAIDRKVIALAFRFHHERWGGVAEGVCPTFSINLSGASLGDDRMVESIRAQLERYRLPPASICFEITETSAVANLGEASRMLAAVRELGCRFSLDDFGSGFSSFSYLKTLPVDFLKIDGAFVRDMAHDSIDAAMVGAINSIGHVMGIRTIAECVEDPAILELLRGIGVDYAQGYGIARPVPLEDIEPASA